MERAGFGRFQEVSLFMCFERCDANVGIGNQYSIENELQKPARIFFSQGCEEVYIEDEE